MRGNVTAIIEGLRKHCQAELGTAIDAIAVT